MAKGIGCDIIEISRIKKSIARHGQHFYDKVYSKREQTYCLKHADPAPHFAVRFAAKEAIVKALGTGLRKGIGWQDIEIINNSDGKPEVHFSNAVNELFSYPQVLISLSHCREYAMATALLL